MYPVLCQRNVKYICETPCRNFKKLLERDSLLLLCRIIISYLEMPRKTKGFHRKSQGDAEVVKTLWYDEVSTIVIEDFKTAMK